jgi:hypothetical protein
MDGGVSSSSLKTSLQDYKKRLKEMRICNKCGKEMLEGYCIEGGFEYYCSKECLLEEMTWEEFLELYDDGEGDSYWTEWYDEIDNEDWDEEKEVEEVERIERELRGE